MDQDTPSQAGSSPWRATLLVITGVVVLFLASIALLLLRLNHNGDKAWAAEQQRLRQSGTPFQLDQLRTNSPPDDLNFVSVPLFTNLFQYLPGSTSIPPSQAWLGRKAKSQLDAALRLPLTDREKRSRAGTNALSPRLDLADWAARLAKRKNANPDIPASDPARAVLAHLSTQSNLLAQLEGTLARPSAHFPYRSRDGFDALLPHVSVARDLSWFLRLRSAARLATDDIAGARRDIQLIHRLAEGMGADEAVISLSVRCGLERLAAAAFWQGWSSRKWSADDYAFFQARFADLSLRSNLVQAFQMDRANVFAMAEASIDGTLSPENVQQLWNLSPVRLRLIPRGWIRQHQVAYSHWVSDVTEWLGQLPAGEAITLHTPFPAARPGSEGRLAFIRVFSGHIGGVSAKIDRAQTTLVLAQTACALERHRSTHGQFPATLRELVPAWLPSVPKDPFSGDPLVYTRKPDGEFTLYSIAWNFEDDAGKGGDKAIAPAPDWAWPSRTADDLHGL